MKADNIYSKTEIHNIPIIHLKSIIEDELTDLLFDFGQKVNSSDVEFQYMVSKISNVLLNEYPTWKLNYLDECLRKGKIDEYDKGQRVTIKRLEYWFKTFNISTKDALKKQRSDREYTPEENTKFIENSKRFPKIIKFRQSRKPEFDGDEWNLTDIEKLPEYKNWLKRNGSQVLTTNHLISNAFRL